MNYLSAWQAYTGSVYQWLRDLCIAGDVDANSTVWAGANGAYAVGDDYDPEDFEDDTEYTDSGTVGDWLSQDD